jgi:hypothetical protein
MNKDPFINIEPDTSPGQNVKKDWEDQEALNLIDMIEQKMNGGIKPMKDQFPGEQDGIDPKDLFESDMINRHKRMSFMERVEAKMKT